MNKKFKPKNQQTILEWYWWVIIIIIAIFAILFFVGSFGTIDVTVKKEKPEKRPTREKIQIKHRKLLETIIQKREQIYQTRKRIYNIVYFSIRILVIGAWVTGNLLLYFKFEIQDLGIILDYNNALIIVLVAIFFVVWGKLSTLKDWIALFEKRLELWIFKKYVRLPELIENNKTALKNIEKE